MFNSCSNSCENQVLSEDHKQKKNLHPWKVECSGVVFQQNVRL